LSGVADARNRRRIAGDVDDFMGFIADWELVSIGPHRELERERQTGNA
jgi:hypothetical protein